METWHSDCEFCGFHDTKEVKIYDSKYNGALYTYPEGWRYVEVGQYMDGYYNEVITKLGCPKCVEENKDLKLDFSRRSDEKHGISRSTCT
jgi:hypothetical protein